MGKASSFAITATAALACTASTGNALANNTNPYSSTEKAAAAVLNKDAIVALEKSAFEAWKSKNASFWDSFLSEKFVGWGASGRLDKVSATKEYTGADCEIKSYSLSQD